MVKRFLFSGIWAWLWLVALLWTLPAQADTISGVITADNSYMLFLGDDTGTSLTQITSGNNWQAPQSVNNSAVPAGSYLYVAAWNWASYGTGPGNPQAWLAEFTLPGGRKLYSNLSDWVYKNTTAPPNSASSDQVKALIQDGALWNSGRPSMGSDLAINNMSLNGAVNIWTSVNKGPIAGISTGLAYWTWWDTFQDSASQNGYALFRSKDPVAPVPIPGSALLLGSGLVRLWAARRKARHSLS